MANKQIHELPLGADPTDADMVVVSQSSTARRLPLLTFFSGLIRKTAEFNAQLPIYSPSAGTFILIDYNRIVGTILGVDIKMTVGSCAATFQIADDDGSAATAITGLSGISVTTARQSINATAANTLLGSGTADRQLLVALSSVVGAGPVLIGLRYKRLPGV